MANSHRRRSDKTSVTPPRSEATEGRKAFLLVLAGPQVGERFDLTVGSAHVIGRVDGSDVLLRDDGISRRHARITLGTGEALLEDLGSSNGSYVNGQLVTSQVICDGDRIQVGASTTLKFVYSDAMEVDYQSRLAEGALIDHLTGLSNRRSFMSRLSAELSLAIRHGRSLALLMLDIDRFKTVNDTHGHLAGDETLKTVARVLERTARNEDVVARFGGEEFVVMARETNVADARALAERIRKAVEDSVSHYESAAIRVTASLGVAVCGREPFQAGASELRLLEAADAALRHAKESGRNAVVADVSTGG